MPIEIHIEYITLQQQELHTNTVPIADNLMIAFYQKTAYHYIAFGFTVFPFHLQFPAFSPILL